MTVLCTCKLLYFFQLVLAAFIMGWVMGCQYIITEHPSDLGIQHPTSRLLGELQSDSRQCIQLQQINNSGLGNYETRDRGTKYGGRRGTYYGEGQRCSFSLTLIN